MFKVKKGELVWKPTEKLPNLKSANRIGIDVETKDPNILTMGPGGYRKRDGYICGICVATDDGFSGYIPLRHPETQNFDQNEVRDWFNEQMSGQQPKVGANIMYDLEWLDAEGYAVNGPLRDVQIAQPLLDEYRRSYNLDSLAKEFLPEIFWKQGSGLKERAEGYLGIEIKKDARPYIWQLPGWIVGPYGEMDAVASLKVFEAQEKLIKEEGIEQIFDLECRLLRIVLDMRKRGVRIDAGKIGITKRKMQDELDKVRREIRDLVGFNIESLKSADQLKPAYDKLGVEYPLTKKTQKPSITKPWMQSQTDPLSPLVLQGRSYMTAISTFLDGALGEHLVGDRIHCQINTLRSDEFGTVSGRFSCSNPNPQQIPGREDAFADIIRSLFIPDENQIWWKIDWSQIEYRFIVHYAYISGLFGADKARGMYLDDPKTDFHQMVADMCGIDRKPAKNINFGIAYGMGRVKLKSQLGYSDSETKRIFTDYKKNAPFIEQLGNNVGKKAKQRGWIKTILGRKRRFNLWEPPNNYKISPDYVDPLPHEEALAEWGTCISRAKTYTAMNALIQGSAADLMKKSMVDAYEAGIFDILGSPTLTIHDELDGSMDDSDESRDALRELVDIMNKCIKLKVPVVAEPQIGTNWWNVENFS